MSTWRRIALERLPAPALKELIETVNSPMGLWHELLYRLEKEYEAEPRDEKLIAQIFEYAAWCLRYSDKFKSHDMSTEVVVAFYEHLPRNEAIRRDLHRRVSREDFEYIGESWNYLLDEDEKIYCPKESKPKRK